MRVINVNVSQDEHPGSRAVLRQITRATGFGVNAIIDAPDFARGDVFDSIALLSVAPGKTTQVGINWVVANPSLRDW